MPAIKKIVYEKNNPPPKEKKKNHFSDEMKEKIADLPGVYVYGSKVRLPLRLKPELAMELLAMAGESGENLHDFICRQLEYLHGRGTLGLRLTALEKRIEELEKSQRSPQ